MTIIRLDEIKPNVQTIKSDIASESGRQTYVPVDKKLQEDLYSFGVNNINPLANLNEEAALLQPFSNKLWRSTKNFTNLAGTTFLDGTVGFVTGLANLAKGGDDGNIEFNDFIDNPFSSGLQEWVDEGRADNVLYKSQQEQDNKWYQNMNTSNFWLGQLENAGFLVGALGAGIVTGGIGAEIMGLNNTAKYSKLLGALGKIDAVGDGTVKTAAKTLLKAAEANPMRLEQIGEDIIQMASKLKSNVTKNQIASSVLGSMGEARIEALSNGKDWEKQQLEVLKGIYGENIPQEALDNLKNEKKYLENTIFGLNTALLSISNFSQFKNLFTGGVKLNERILANTITRNVTEEGLEFGVKQLSRAEKAAKYIVAGAKNPITEMTEEQLQFAVGEGSKDYFNLENNEASKGEVKKILGSIFKGLEEAYGSDEGLENAFAGLLMGAIGIPSIKKNDKGNYRPVMGGGIANGIREYNEQLKATNSAVAKANEYASDSQFRRLFDYLVTDSSVQKTKNEAQSRNLEAVVRTQEKVQLANMVAAFSDVGQLNVLRDKLTGMSDIIDRASNGIAKVDFEKEVSKIDQAIAVLQQKQYSSEGAYAKAQQEIVKLEQRKQEVTEKAVAAQDTKGGNDTNSIAEVASELRKMFAYNATEEVNGQKVESSKNSFADLSDEALVSKIKDKVKKQTERIDKLEEVYQSINTRFANHSEESRKSLYLNVVQSEDALERGNKLLSELQQVASTKKSSNKFFKERVKRSNAINNLLERVNKGIEEGDYLNENLLNEGNQIEDLIQFTKGKRSKNLEELRDSLKEGSKNFDKVLGDKQAEFEEDRAWRSASDLVEFSALMQSENNAKAFDDDIVGIIKSYPTENKVIEKGTDLRTLAKYRDDLISKYYSMVTGEELISADREKKKAELLDKSKRKGIDKLAVNAQVAELYKNITSYVDGQDLLEEEKLELFPEVKELVVEAKQMAEASVTKVPTKVTTSKFVSGAIQLTTKDGFSKQFIFKENDPNTLYEQVSNGKEYVLTGNKIATANFVRQVDNNLNSTGEAVYIDFTNKVGQDTASETKGSEVKNVYKITYINSDDVQRSDRLDRIDRQFQARIESLESLAAEQEDAASKLVQQGIEPIQKEIETVEQELKDAEKEYNDRSNSNKYNSKAAKDKTFRLFNQCLKLIEKLEVLKETKTARQQSIRLENSNVFDVLEVLNKNLEEVKSAYKEFNMSAAFGQNTKDPQYLERINRNAAKYDLLLSKFEKVKEDLTQYKDNLDSVIERLDTELDLVNSEMKSIKNTFNSLLDGVIKLLPKNSISVKTIDELHSYFNSNYNKLSPELKADIEQLIVLSYDYFDQLNTLVERRQDILNEKSKLGHYKKITGQLSRLSSFKVQAEALKEAYKTLREQKEIKEQAQTKKFSIGNKKIIETEDTEDGSVELNLHKATYADVYGWGVSTGVDSDKNINYKERDGTSNPVIEERRLFRWLENEGLEAKSSDYRLMSVTIYDKTYGIGGTDSVYTDPKEDGVNHNEDDIRLVLVDKEGNAVKAYGGIAFTKMRTLDKNFTNGTPRYSFFNKKLDAKTQQEILENELLKHKQTRDSIKDNPEKNQFFEISAFNPGTPIKNGSKTPVVGTVIDSEEAIKDLQIMVSIGEKTEKGENTRTMSLGDRSIKYPKGRVLFKLGKNQGATWVSAITRKISAEEAGTVVELIRTYLEEYANSKEAKSKNRVKEAKKALDGFSYGVKTYIENLVYLSEDSKNPFDVREDVITFGGTVVTLANLEYYKKEMIEYLQQKPLNINNTTLSTLNKATKNEADLPAYFSITWNGFAFEEVKWPSYKHYLVSSKNPDGSARAINETPLTSYIRMKQVGATEEQILNDEARRFQQGYIVYNNRPTSADSSLSAEAKETVKTSKPAEPKGPNSGATKFTAKSDKFEVSVDLISLTVEFKADNPANKPTMDKLNKRLAEDSQVKLDLKDAIEGDTLKEQISALISGLGLDPKDFKFTTEREQKVEAATEEAENKEEDTGIRDSILDFFGTTLTPEEVEAEAEAAKTKAGIEESSSLTEEEGGGPSSVLDSLFNSSENTINIEEAENWLADTLGIDLSDNVVYERTNNLIEGISNGRVLKNGKILLSSIGNKGTEYHEAFHYVSNLLISREEQEEIYTEWRKANNLPNATRIKVEEGLADNFKAYMLSKKAAKKEKSLFDKIVNLIKAALGLNSQPKIDRLFQRIENGEFKNAPRLYNNIAFSKLDSSVNNAEMAKQLHKEVVSVLFNADTKALYAFNPESNTPFTKEVYKKAILGLLTKNSLIAKFRTFGVEQQTTIVNNFIDLHKSYIKPLGYKVSEEDTFDEFSMTENEETNNDGLGKNEEQSKEASNESFKESYLISQKSKIKPVLKSLIISLAPTYEYDKLLNKLMNRLANSLNYGEMKARLIRSKDPAFKELYSILNVLEDRAKTGDVYSMKLIGTFYNTFFKHKESFSNLIINPNGEINRIDTNTTRINDVILRKWQNNMLTTDSQYVTRANGKITLSDKGKALSEYGVANKLKFLKAIGFTFNDEAALKEHLQDSENLDSVEDNKNIDFIIKDLKSGQLTLDAFSSRDFYTNPSLKRLRRLVDLEVSLSEDVVENLGITAKGELTHIVTLHNFVSKLIDSLTNTIVPNYLKNDAYAKDSIILERSERKAGAIRTGVTNGLNRAGESGEDVSQLSFRDYLIVELDNILSKNYSFLITGDKKTARTFEMKNHLVQVEGLSTSGMINNAVDQLYKYYQTEVKMIAEQRNKPEVIVQGEQVLNDLIIFNNIKDNAGLTLTVADTEQTAKRKIKEYVEQQVKSNYNLFETSKIITEDSILLNNQVIKDILAARNVKDIVINKETIDRLITAFTVNNMVSAIEQTKVFFGNPAYYTTKFKDNKADFAASFIDMFKRYAGAIATTKPLMNDKFTNDWMDEFRPRLDGKSGEARSKVKIVTFDDIKGVNEELKILGVEGYNDIEETDSFAICMDDFYRDLLFKSDSWTEEMDEAWEKEARGIESDSILPSLKPVIYAPSSNNALKPFYVKFALLRLSPTLINALKDGDAFPALHQLYNKMRDADIQGDIAVFKSGNKVGSKVRKTVKDEEVFYKGQKFYNKKGDIADLDEELITEISMDYVGIQVENAAKDKEETTRGTQEAAIIASNLAENGKFIEGTVEIKGKKLTFEQATKELFSRQSELTEYYLKQVKDEIKVAYVNGKAVFKDGGEALKTLLVNEITSRGEIPDNQIEAIISELNSLNKGEPVYLDLLVNANKIEPVLYSIFEKRAIDQHRFGKSLIQFPDTGTEIKVRSRIGGKFKSEGLKFYKDGKTMEVYLPYYFSETLAKGSVINKIDANNLKMYGFRIPTEQLNSLESIVVKGFLPKSYGNTCIVPSGITAKVGSDFDFDKINIYYPNFEKKKLNSLDFKDFKSSIEFFSISKENRKAIAGLSYPELNTVIKDLDGMLSEDTLEESKQGLLQELRTALDKYKERRKQEGKDIAEFEYKYIEPNTENLADPELREKALQNRILELTIGLLEGRTAKERFETNSISKFKDLSLEIETKLQQFYPNRQKPDYSFTDLLNFRIIATLRTMFWYGKGLVGVFALHNKNHPLAQVTGLKINSEIKLNKQDILKYNINFKGITKDENGYYPLGNIYTVGEDGKPTTEKISVVTGQAVSLAVDVVKNPEVMERFNLNNSTADVFMFLIRTGVPSETALYFISQPIIRDYVERISLKKSLSVFDRESNEEIVKSLKASYGTNKYNDLTVQLLKSFNRQIQGNILGDFLTYKEVAFKLSEMQSSFAFDTKGLGTTEVIKDNLLLNEEVIKLGNFKNIDAFGSTTFLNSFKKVYNDSGASFRPLFLTQQVDSIRLAMNDFRNTILSTVYSKKDKARVTKLMQNDFKAAMLSFNGDFNNWKELFSGPNSLPKRLKEYQIRNSNTPLDYILPMINPDGDNLDNVRMSNRKLNSYVMEEISNKLSEMLEGDKESKSLAQDIINFSLTQSGFNYNQFSISQILPALYTKRLFKKIIESTSVSSFMNRFETFKTSFYINNWRNSNVVPFVSYKKIAGKKLNALRYGNRPFVKTRDYDGNYIVLQQRELANPQEQNPAKLMYNYEPITIPELTNIKGKVWNSIPDYSFMVEFTKEELLENYSQSNSKEVSKGLENLISNLKEKFVSLTPLQKTVTLNSFSGKSVKVESIEDIEKQIRVISKTLSLDQIEKLLRDCYVL